jgi:branched-chain amino acid transport system permease protein
VIRLRQRIPHDYVILVILVLVLFPLPLFLNQFQVRIAILIIYWAYLGLAWNILGGYAGQFSFGHAAYYGLGAYTSTVLLVDYGISPWLGMIAGAGVAALFGLASGYLSFRYGLKGPYFALATFAFAEMLRLIGSELELINTSVGIHIPPIGGDSWARFQFDSTLSNYYFVILGLFTFGMLVTITLVRSKWGYYFQAIREDEDAAAALGVDPLRYKVIAATTSGAMTALGGSFFVQYFFFIEPSLAFGVRVSIDILLRPIVGGMGTIWGPLIGALFLTPLAEFTRAFVRTPPEFLNFIEGRAGVDVMIFGAILIVVIIFMPDGIVGATRRFWHWVKKDGRNDA